MDLTFRTFVEILNINTSVYYTPKELLCRENYLYFNCLGKNAEAAIRNGNYNPAIDYNDDVGIHLPDIDVFDYYCLEENRNPIAMHIRIEEISRKVMLCIPEIPIAYAVFGILHEYGHFLHFVKSGKNPYEYCQMERNERLPYEKIRMDIYKMDDYDPLKIIFAEEYERNIYSQFNSEKVANNYAIENVENAIKKVRCYFGYTEEELMTMSTSAELHSLIKTK